MNKVREFIAYSGDAFTIEWYFDEHCHSDALEYYNHLNTHERIQLLKLFKRMGDAGEIHDKTKFRFGEIKSMLLNLNLSVFSVFSMKARKLL